VKVGAPLVFRREGKATGSRTARRQGEDLQAAPAQQLPETQGHRQNYTEVRIDEITG